ncbi:SRPBCC family protein [Streptomyces sp. NPDC058457]|uniref:SRPBCC family protein n=1 Tax=Streptomyces sp. NPDC058457 TaxID=3346507 RepID=UPI00364F278A
MQLTNTVPVKAAPDVVFALLSDVQRVASCMPGAALEGRSGDAWCGTVKVKVGPITAAYTGTVRFLEADADKRVLRVHARGADTHGRGDAEAEVLLEVVPDRDGAQLNLATDLVLRGTIAQFGKGAIAAVSDRILQQFAQNLGDLLLSPGGPQEPAGTSTAAASTASVPAGAPPAAASAELNGLSLIAGPLLRKYGPVIAAFALGFVPGWLLGRRR